MKKLFTTAALGLCLTASVFAQDDDYSSSEGSAFDNKSKRGINILPEAGDWSISIGANGLLDFAGGVVGGNTGNTTPWDFVSGDQFIRGKYFVYDDMAYRGILRIGYTNESNKVTVDNMENGAATDPGVETVEDKTNTVSSEIWIGGGLEKRRGHGRVQGVYGAEAMIMIQSTQKVKNEFGNSMEDEFGAGAGNRTLETKNGMSFGIDVHGFVGVEYFFAPKISLGGEFTWGPRFVTEPKTSTTSVAWDGAAEDETTTEGFVGGNSGEFSIDTNNFGGDVFFNFYF